MSFYVDFSSPWHIVRDGKVCPPISAVCACSDRIAFRLCRACISKTYYFPRSFRVHATQVLVVFSCYFSTRLLCSGYRCAQLTTDHSNLLSLLLQAIVRHRRVRVLALDPTVSVHFYLVGTSVVSVIASWPPKVPPCSMSIIEARRTF